MSTTTHFLDPDSFQQKSDEFITWLAGNPGVKISPKIRLADLRGQAAGRGIVAQSDIEEGEDLFTIPRGLILTPKNSKLSGLLSQNLEELGPWLSLILVMMYEYLLGDQSTWAPCFKVLPRNFDTLMFWSPSELQELQGSAVLDKIGKEGAEESILEMIAPIVRANPSLFPPVGNVSSYDGDVGTKVLLELAHVMGSLIMAYADDIEKAEDEEEEVQDESGYETDEEEQLPKGLVPLAFLLNANADGNNAQLVQEDTLAMKAIKPIPSGHEILNDYGEIPRSDLLRRYGFVTDNYAPYDVVEVSLEQICQAAGLSNADIESQPSLAFLENLELLDDGYTIPKPSPEDTLEDIISDELLVLLKTLTLSPQQLDHQKSKDKPPKPTFDQSQAAILQKAIQLKGAQYGTTVAQDKELLAQLNQSNSSLEGSFRRQKMAIEVRIGEKELLQNLFDMLSALGNGSSMKRSANGDDDESRKTKAQRT